MGAFYRDARLKIERAEKHIADFDAAVLSNEHTYRVTVQCREDGGQSLVHEFPDFEKALAELSLIAGDALHNLRTALDFAWYGTIGRLMPDKISEKTKFPARSTRQDVEAAIRGIEIDTRCPSLFHCILEKIQPYDRGHNSVVWTLHDLDISDKHLLLLGLDPVGHIAGISVREHNGATHRGSTMPAQGLQGRYIVDFEKGLTIYDKGKLSVTVTLQEAGIYNCLPVSRLLCDFRNFTFYSVQLLENV